MNGLTIPNSMSIINLKPNEQQLRQFGWISAVGFLVIMTVFGIKFQWFENSKMLWPMIFVIGSVLSATLALIYPKGLLPLYLTMMILSFPIGFVVGNVILLILFFLVFAPIGIFFRLIRRDELKIKLEPSMKSYWVKVVPPKSAESYLNQY